MVDLEDSSDAAGYLGFGTYFKGFWFVGPFLNINDPLLIRNYFQWWWQHMSRGCSGAKSMSCFA